MVIKILGALIGGMYGGFLGAWIGWMLAGGVESFLRRAGVDFPSMFGGLSAQQRQAREQVFLSTLFGLAGRLAKTDKHVSRAEIDHVEGLIKQFGMSAEQRQQAIDDFNAGVANDYDVRAKLNSFLAVAGGALQLKHTLLVSLLSLAVADGHYHAAERSLINKVAQALGYSARALAQLEAMLNLGSSSGQQSGQQGGWQDSWQGGRSTPPPNAPPNALTRAYQTLGVDKHISNAQLKRAYRKLMSQHHPDKLIAKGVPEAVLKQATERAKEITTAYETISKARGLS